MNDMNAHQAFSSFPFNYYTRRRTKYFASISSLFFIFFLLFSTTTIFHNSRSFINNFPNCNHHPNGTNIITTTLETFPKTNDMEKCHHICRVFKFTEKTNCKKIKMYLINKLHRDNIFLVSFLFCFVNFMLVKCVNSQFSIRMKR